MFLFARAVGVASPWFSVTAAFVLLGILDLMRPFGVLRVPGALVRIRKWEQRGFVHRRLGVIAFGRLLRRTPLRLLNRRVYLAAKAGDLDQVRHEVAAAEAAHFWAGVMTLPYVVLAFTQRWWSSLLALLVFNLAAHVLPILHLRWVRLRISRVMLPGMRPPSR